MKLKDCEINYFSIGIFKGIMFGFGTYEYPLDNRVDFVIQFLFLRLAWVKQLVDEDEADKFLNE